MGPDVRATSEMPKCTQIASCLRPCASLGCQLIGEPRSRGDGRLSACGPRNPVLPIWGWESGRTGSFPTQGEIHRCEPLSGGLLRPGVRRGRRTDGVCRQVALSAYAGPRIRALHAAGTGPPLDHVPASRGVESPLITHMRGILQIPYKVVRSCVKLLMSRKRPRH